MEDHSKTADRQIPQKSQPIGLYVHVPFCVSKCAYCDFASYAGREADIARYVDAVVREISWRGRAVGHLIPCCPHPRPLSRERAMGGEKADERLRANTIFLGGGTPSLLNAHQATRILNTLADNFAIAPNAEITCECNPGTLSADFAEALHTAGVNRLSMGAQAAETCLLQRLGRIHTWSQVVASVEIARRAGFENLNLDLMFSLPGQTMADLHETLAAALKLSPEHLSCYSLIVEEGTPIARDIAAGRLALPDEELDRAMYETIRQTLAAAGFEQYEISNFARPGFACRHNIGCWTRVPYLGFGSAAHSFFDDCRTANPANLDAYLAGDAPTSERITAEKARFESLMLGLRMTRGVSDADFTRMHGLSIREAFGQKLEPSFAAGLVEWHDGSLRLTRRGMDLEDTVLVDLL